MFNLKNIWKSRYCFLIENMSICLSKYMHRWAFSLQVMHRYSNY